MSLIGLVHWYKYILSLMSHIQIPLIIRYNKIILKEMI